MASIAAKNSPKPGSRLVIVLALVFALLGGCLIVRSHHAFASGSAAGNTTHVCAGRSFYIDYTGGSDSNNGTSTATPWKLAPGMAGFSASYSHQAHDCFYFKGGITWPNAAFPMTFVHGQDGDSSANDYYGPNYGWYSGSSWSRPIFNAQGATISGDKNAFIDLTGENYGSNYITIDNIELTGFHWSVAAPAFGSCEMIDTYNSSHLDFENLYIHGWSHSPPADDSGCYVIKGDTTGTFCQTCVFNKGVIDGSDSTNGGDSLAAFYAFTNVTNSVIRNVGSLILAINSGTISGNLLENCVTSFSGSHENFIETLQGSSNNGTFYIHDNVIRNGTSDCEPMFLGNPGETDYVWNNVIYGLTGNPLDLTQNVTSGVAAYYWNNTIVTGSSNSCVNQRPGSAAYSVIEFINNHCISTASTVLNGSVAATTLTQNHNLLQSPAAAAAGGYGTGSAFAYQPTTASAATIGTGANLTSDCAIAAGLCSDTTYACGIDSTNQVVMCPAHSSVGRPATGAWDIGAYEGVTGSSLAGDLNADGQVNSADLNILISDWGTSNSTADLNSDGVVNVLDLSILLSHYGS